MTLQLPINFTAHQNERTAEGTEFARSNQVYMTENCRKLVAFWQKENRWLSKYEALQLLGVDCLAQRIADIRKSGIEIESETVKGERFKRYRLKTL